MNKLTQTLTAVALTAIFGLASIAPASADQAAATRNMILGATALVAGIAIASNVARKRAQANTIVGYTPNGDAIYGNGQVATSNGTAYYPNQYNPNQYNPNQYNPNQYSPNQYNQNAGWNGNGWNGVASNRDNRWGRGRR